MFGNMMFVRNHITWICNLIFYCFDFAEGHVHDSSVVCELPESAIFEILLKLPVKSIFRCRYVCKSWYQLISSPYFASVYFKNSPFTAFAITEHETLANKRHDPIEHSFKYVEIGRNGDVIHRPLNIKAFTSPVIKTKWSSKNIVGSYDKSIVGSCDGLLCLVETPYVESNPYLVYITMHSLFDPNQTVSIANPLIGECMALPKFNPVNNNVRVAYGFGSTVDGEYYKVVRIATEYYGCVVEAQILTIGVDEKWRELDIYILPLFVYSHGVIMNGVLHFVGSNNYNLESNGVLYAFDIGNEKGHCFALPCAIRYRHFKSRVYLSMWNGHLCVSDCSNEIQIDIWTMKQYGVVESWRKDITLRRLKSWEFTFIPISTMRNGDLLVCHINHHLCSFAQETGNLVEVKGFDRKRTRYFLAGCAYTPCFLSPWDIITRERKKKEEKRSADVNHGSGVKPKGFEGTKNVVSCIGGGISHGIWFSSRGISRDMKKYYNSLWRVEEARLLGIDQDFIMNNSSFVEEAQLLGVDLRSYVVWNN